MLIRQAVGRRARPSRHQAGQPPGARRRTLLVIDVAFMQIRPSPWREAVDLANMMLVLAVRTDAERVYERALQYFSPDEIAEAFAAARGIASPSQLRTAMKRDGRDLLAQFRALAPERRPISLQRWSVKRVALAAGARWSPLFVVVPTRSASSPRPTTSGSTGTPELRHRQPDDPHGASRSRRRRRCRASPSLPAGWDIGGVQIRRRPGHASGSTPTSAATRAVEVTLLPAGARATVDGATEVPSDEVGMRRFEQPEALPPDLRSTRTYLFDGGCVTYTFDFDGDATGGADVRRRQRAGVPAPRGAGRRGRASSTGLRLCGAGAPCPGGS